MCDLILEQPLFEPNLPFRRLNEALFSIVEKQNCGHHTQRMIAKMLHVSHTTLSVWLREEQENIQNESSMPCHFCKIITEWNGPIISTPTSKNDSNLISPTTINTPTTPFLTPKTPFLRKRKIQGPSNIDSNSEITLPLPPTE